MRYEAQGLAVAEGLIAACETYGAWSRDFDVHGWGVEPFLSVKVAERLHGSFPDSCFVSLETGIKWIFQWSGARKGQIADVISRDGRVDVVFFDKRDFPKGLVEIKRHFRPSEQASDVERTVAMLRRFGPHFDGSLQWGAVAGVHSIYAHNRDDAETRVQRAKSAFEDEYPDVNFTPIFKEKMLPIRTRTPGDEILGVAALCLMMTLKRQP
jgi:hypothetical protein